MATIWAVSAAVLAFTAVVLFVIGIASLVSDTRKSRRLRAIAIGSGRPNDQEIIAPREDAVSERSRNILSLLSRLSLPDAGWQTDEVRLKFVRAGISDPKTPLRFYAARTVLTIILPAVAGILLWGTASESSLLANSGTVLVMGALGYYVPEFYIRHQTKIRVEEMRQALPDVIDLLVICTESGLSLDQALARVSIEVGRTRPGVAAEFHLVTLEIRAGAGRASALRNLAMRVELDDLASLASTMIQADKFGTGIAEALRIQSETMRIKRMQRAEETAAKVPTKMLLPLVFMIFPALMIVILGPAMIKLTATFAENAPWR